MVGALSGSRARIIGRSGFGGWGNFGCGGPQRPTFVTHMSKYLRPTINDSSDDDDDEEEDHKATANLSSSEDDDDDDESDQHEATAKRKATGSAKARPAKKKSKASFFDTEADDDDDEENEDGEGMDEEALEIIRRQDERRNNAGLSFLENDHTALAKNIEQRHRRQQKVSMPIVERPRNHDVDAVPYTAAVAQQSLVPSVKDPNMWIINCSTGKEQELVYQIMNKCIAAARSGRPLGITSAIAAQSKGKIYIESYSEPAVRESITGIRNVMGYSAKLVPISDMTTVMNVVPKKKPVKAGDWVRLTRGHYKGDLARVKEAKESGLKCIVQAIPRLDLTLSDLPPEQARIRRKTVRPAQKFFSVQEIANTGRQSVRQRFPGMDIFCDYFEGNHYLEGYLLKEMTVGNMVKPCTDDDPPTLDELQRFQRQKQNDDDDVDDATKAATSLLEELSALQGTANTSAATGLGVGDMVEVTEGDLVGVVGKIVSLDGNTVKVKADNLASEVEFLVSQVSKYIPVGMHVKVMGGRYANETGVVVALDNSDGDAVAVLLTDITNNEISVRTSQLRESAEIASGQDRLQGYELYDLVGLSGGGSANENGVIVRVGREDFTVINNHGRTREVRPEELRGKFNRTSNKAVAMDARGNQIRTGDTVSVTEGNFKGKTATVKRIHRSQLFLHSQTRTENAGVFVVRSRTCLLTGSRSQTGAPDGNTMSPFATPQSHSAGPARHGRADDGLTGKTVRIQAGQWKGYIGTVADSTATHVQVELHSRLKKVMVVRERVAVVGDKYGATANPNEIQIPGSVAATNQNPGVMATPMHAIGGATPAVHGFGGATPSHGSDENDEVWRPGGTIDQDTTTGNDDGWEAAAQKTEDTENTWGGADSGSAWDAADTSATEKTEKSEPAASTTTKKLETMEEAAPTDTPVWFMENVCVTLNDGGEFGTIKEVNGIQQTAVLKMQDGSTKNVRLPEVSMVPPKEHDTVLVAGGAEIGLEGSLVCVDGNDAIVKNASDEYKIIEVTLLVKVDRE